MAKASTTALLGGASTLLDKVLHSRLQRKAKSIIMSCLQFLFVELALFATALDLLKNNRNVQEQERENGEEDEETWWFRNISTERIGAYAVLAASASYATFVCIFIYIHSVTSKPLKSRPGPDGEMGTIDDENAESKTTKAVESAYARSNKIPILDGILELPFPAKFKGNFWYLPYFAWVWAGACIGSGVFVFLFALPNGDDEEEGGEDDENRNELNHTTQAALSAAALLLYQVTSDFSEYWVQSRHLVDSGSDSGSGSGKKDDGDIEIASVGGASFASSDKFRDNMSSAGSKSGSGTPTAAASTPSPTGATGLMRDMGVSSSGFVKA
jgi:hypothetical protein